ncbi:ligase-associated DNA damage response endonuclease PdeM [Planctomicrobium sp. SH661]|uniref:ligase-associated DNA damage response endonuclease PdeM n=1 Tax=Planctomicrobium sp. SH661 TaxID=3448124 RepID=UPI003F5C67F0
MPGISSGSLSLEFNDCRLELLPERAAFWSEESTLFVTDLHIGKEETFRRAGLPVPDVLPADLSRLNSAIARTGCTRLVILGDFYHASPGRSKRVTEQLSLWRRSHSQLHITLIRGNHDLHAGAPLREWEMEVHDEPFRFRHLSLAHFPCFDWQTPVLAGHLHPKFRLQCGPERLHLPCFLERKQTLVLPAFSNFVDHGLIKRQPADRIYVVADDHVLEV